MTPDYHALFDIDGPLARAIDGFTPRHEQQQLAVAIGNTLDHGGVLAAEAGTGVGKTFAYLAPVLQAGRKVLISTGTRTLQDQIFHRDLDIMRHALGQPVDIALLKGRSNYLCDYRLDKAVHSKENYGRAVGDLNAVRRWAEVTQTGDRAELDNVADKSPIWPRVTSTAENCLGSDCPFYSQCWVVKARRDAQQADVVVVNHHLLLADMALKNEGVGELLPQVDAVIVDEAHKFPDIAGQYFGESVSLRQLRELARDIRTEYLDSAGDMPDIIACLRGFDTRLSQLRVTLGTQDVRLDWAQCQGKVDFAAKLDGVGEALDQVRQYLEELGERSRGLDNCRARAQEFAVRLTAYAAQESENTIRWAETRSHNAIFHLTPEDVAPRLAKFIHADHKAWVLTSATLAVGGALTHFCKRMGLGDSAEQLVLGSPFDYPRHARIYLPQNLPQPNTPGYTEAVMAAALPLIRANRGRAFLLFTTHKAVRLAAQYLRNYCDCQLFVQDDAPRTHLVEQFRHADNAVLLGTASFWEGVDVKGAALSLVVVDKLPFAPPSDPVVKAQMDRAVRHGGNGFRDVSLPQAVITLKQGAGRLIRDSADTGVLMLADPRLNTKSYGKVFLNSLPPMTRTHSLDDVLAFIGTHRAETTTTPL